MRVRVQTGARLHFGLLSYQPTRGRHFGGVGAMIASPGHQLRVERLDNSRADEIIAAAPWADRAVGVLNQLRQCDDIPPLAVELEEVIPPHAGLGSGTQFDLALSAAAARLCGGSVDAQSLAERTRRAKRSAIGTYGFEQGGLIVDAGHRDGESVAGLACRLGVPEQWRFVLIHPSAPRGLYGAAEREAFQQLGPMPDELSARLCRIVLTELLPAVQASDWAATGEALYEYGRRVGQFFSPVQGGVTCLEHGDDMLAFLRDSGIPGVGQSSWGPALFALAKSEEQAADLIERCRNESLFEQAEFRNAAPLNQGARLS